MTLGIPVARRRDRARCGTTTGASFDDESRRDCSADHRDSPVAVRFHVVDVSVSDVGVQKTAEIPQLQFIKVVDTPFVTQRLIPMVLVTIAILQSLLDKVVDAPIMQVVQVAKIPVVAQRLLHMVQLVLHGSHN